MKYVFIMVLILAAPAAAFACSCGFGGGPPCQEYWSVDAVFSGTVVGSSRISVVDSSFKHEMRLVRMTVEQPIRGMDASEVDVLTGLGGGDCGFGFQMGKRYLVYAYRDAKDKRLSTSICTRTRLIAEASDDLAFIRALSTASQQGLILGTVGKRNYEWTEGQEWFKPVSDAELTIEGEGTQYQVVSDAKGNFRVENVLPGKYRIELKLPTGLIRGGLKEEGAATIENEVEVAARGCAETGFYLEADTRVSGRVLDVEGNSVANLRLEMMGASSDKRNINTFLHAATGADGSFEFNTVPPGDYVLGFRIMNSMVPDEQHPYPRTYYPGVTSKALATVISVKEGRSLRRFDLQLPSRLSPYTVSGVVVWSDGRPVGGASVYLNVIEESEMSGFSSVQTDAEGRFSLKLFDGLRYKISAFRQGQAGKNTQSEWIEIPLDARNQPIKLVLAQPQ